MECLNPALIIAIQMPPDKVSRPEVVSVGTSDQLGIVVKKYTKIQMRKPSTIMKRSYKQFDVEK